MPGRGHGHSVQTFPVPQSLLGGLLALLSYTTADHLVCTQRAPSFLMLEFCGESQGAEKCRIQRRKDPAQRLSLGLCVKAEQWEQGVVL